MQHLEVSGAVRLIYRSLGVKGLTNKTQITNVYKNEQFLPSVRSVLSTF